MKTFIVIFFGTFATAAGEAMLSHGMKQVGDVSAMAQAHAFGKVLGMFVNPFVIGGILLMAAFFALYSFALSWADLSFVQPLTAMTFVFGALIAKFALGEHVSMWRWAGIGLIILGVVLISRDAQQLTAAG